MKSEIPQWVIEYNNANHQSSAGKAIKILMDENERMAELLKEAHETIGDLLLRINKKDELISEAHNSMISILKVCQSPTLTTHGLSNIDKAVGVVNQLRRELESLKSQQHENRRVL